MDDDEGSEVIRSTDLSHDPGTSRANAYIELEEAKVKAGPAEVSSKSYPGSSLNEAVTTFCLVAGVSLMTGVTAIHLPVIFALLAAVGVVVGIYLLVHFLPSRRPR